LIRVPNHEGSAIAMAYKSSKPLVICNYNGNIRVPTHKGYAIVTRDRVTKYEGSAIAMVT
jgi:hypothetical protein